MRALFLFADGEPIGDEGLKWLKVHTANCGDFGKISKRAFEERVRWTDDNLEKIKSMTTVLVRKLKADRMFASQIRRRLALRTENEDARHALEAELSLLTSAGIRSRVRFRGATCPQGQTEDVQHSSDPR